MRRRQIGSAVPSIYLLRDAPPDFGRLSRAPPNIPVSQCVLLGESPGLLPVVGSNLPAKALHLYHSQPLAKRSVYLMDDYNVEVTCSVFILVWSKGSGLQ